MKRLLSCVLILSAICLSGCVDREFDLDDLNTEISVGDGQELDLPLGYFEERTLDQIIGLDEKNHLYTDDDGNYYFMLEEKEGKINLNFPQTALIPSISSTFSIGIGSIAKGYSGPVPATTMTGSTTLQTGLEINGKFASYLKAIDRVMFKPDEGRETASMRLQMKLNTLSSVNSSSTFTVTITAPEGMELYDGETGTGKSTMVRTINFQEGETVAQTEVRFKDMKLTPDKYTLDSSGNFHLSTTFGFDVAYSFTSKSGTVSNVTLPSLAVDASLAYKGAELELTDHAFDREETVVEVGSITGGYDVVINNMDLNPLVYIQVGNTAPIKAETDVTLSYVAKKAEVDDIAVVAAVWNDGKMTRKGENDVLLARENTGEGKEFYECDFTSLFEGKIPEKLNVGIDLKSLGGKYTVYDAPAFAVDYAYNVQIPLKFGEEFSITFSTVTKGLGGSTDDLKDITAENVSLYIDMYNAMPLDASLPEDGIVLLDKNDKEIDPSLVSLKIVNGEMKGSSDGKEVHSLITARLNLKDGKLSNLNTLEKIRMKFDAESVGDNLTLNTGQKLYGTITIHVVDGMQIKL